MSATDGTTPVVDVNTDNLDDFNALFHGTAQAKTEDEPKQEEDVIDTDDVTEDDDLPESDEAPEEDSKPEDEPKHKNRKSAKERIQELANERREEREARLMAEREAADLRAKLARLENTPKQEETPKPIQRAASEASDAPNPDATDDEGELIYPLGEFDPKFIFDYTKWTIRTETARAKEEAEKDAEQRRAQEEQDKLVTSYEEKLQQTEKDLPDLRDKLETLEVTFKDLEPNYGSFLASTIMQMDRGPEVLYYLAQNISEAQKIVASGPAAAILALGRLEGRLPTKEAEDKSNKTRVSTAPKPPAVTPRGLGASRTVAGDTEDLDAFEREFFGKRK